MADDVRVPAGWYPDPLGLPQLRWWDNHAWTEHTSDARQPMVAQPMRADAAAQTRLAFADDLPFADDLADLEDTAYPSVTPAFAHDDRPSGGTFSGARPHSLDDAATGAAELPTRRELRERERLEGDGTQDPASGAAAFAEPRTAIEAPRTDPDPVAALRYAEATRIDDAPRSARYDLDERHEDLLGEPAIPRSAFDHASSSTTTFIPETPEDPADLADLAGAAQPRASHAGSPRVSYGAPYDPAPAFAARRTALAHAPSTGTVPAWILTLIPVYMLLVGMMVLLSGTDAAFAPVTVALVVGVPWVAGVVLAFVDRRQLHAHGMDRPAHWAWAVLGAPVYLVARLVATVREAGTGFGPVLTYLVLALFMAGSVVAVPGLVMELSPASFAAEAERSVADDASSLGADLAIDCPETPPLLVQQSFTCRATAPDGRQFDVLVSLQRSNGWIDWRVDDWGVFFLGS